VEQAAKLLLPCGMPIPHLDQFMHALMWKAGSTIILCGIGALLLREFLNWIERRGVRFVRGMRKSRVARTKLSVSTVAQRNGGGTPLCPSCRRMMVKRTAHHPFDSAQGRLAKVGSEFWGCSGYPRCRGTRSI
jgi:hypothetical protein